MATYPVLPINPMNQAQPIRGLTWSVIENDEFRTLQQESDNGKNASFPRWTNNRHHWEFVWNYISDGASFQQLPIQPTNAPWSDFQLLKGLRNYVKGAGGIFLYNPPYSNVVGQPLAAPDTNGNVELVYNVGALAFPNPGATGPFTITVVQVLNNLLKIICAATAPSPGANVTFSGVGTATFLNGKTVNVIYSSGNTFYATLIQANYGGAGDTGTVSISSFTPAVTESVQYQTGLVVYQGGNPTVSYTLNPPASISLYAGYTMTFAGTPTEPLTASFTLSYLAQFEDDSISMEQFMFNIYALKSLKVKQFKL